MPFFLTEAPAGRDNAKLRCVFEEDVKVMKG